MKQLRGGFSLLELDVVDSTNEYLKRQGGQLPDKTVVMAQRPGWQAGGRQLQKAGGHPVRKPQWGALLCGVRHRDKPMSAGIFF